jgi:hypothetical protein
MVGVGADLFRLVPAHFVQDDGHASLGDLPGRFGSGEAAADDVDGAGSGGRIRHGGLIAAWRAPVMRGVRSRLSEDDVRPYKRRRRLFMTHGFQIDEALADGFRLIRRRPGSVFAWGVVLALPVLLSAIVMIDLLMTIGLEAMAENADASPQALAAMMRMQAWSMLINVVQLIGYVLIIAAICRAVLWPERAPGRFFDLRVGMDEARVAVAGLAVMAGCYGVMLVVLLLAFAFGAAFWMVSETAAVVLGVAVGLAGIVGIVWAGLRTSMIMPLSIASQDFAFVAGWKMTKGRVGMLLGLFVATLAVTFLVHVLFLIVAGLIALGVSIPFWPQLAVWAQSASSELPAFNPLVVAVAGVAAFIAIAAYYGVIVAIWIAPGVSACRQMLAMQKQDETGAATLS